VNNLRAAIAGVGFMGPTHTQALRRLGIDVVGLLGISEEEGRTAAQRLNVPRFYKSLDELIGDAAVDVVHICTPNYLHYPMAKAALQAGKHVLVEKPLATSSRESAELEALSRMVGRAAAVDYNLRFYPLCQDARARVQAGLLGDVWLIHGSYLQDWLYLPTDWNWRLEPELGGSLRAVADIGTHWLDMVTWISGQRVTAVLADFSTCLPTRQKPRREVETFASKFAQAGDADEMPIHTEDYATVLLRFANGAHGTMTVSQVSAGRKNRLWYEIDGSRSSLAWDSEMPNQLWLGHRESPNELMIKDPALMLPGARATAAFPGGHAEGYPDTFVQMFKAFYSYIAAGDMAAPRAFPTFEDGHAEIVLCDAIAASACDGRWVSVDAAAR